MSKKIVTYIGLFVLFILFSGLLRWMQITLPPHFQYSDDFYINKKVQQYKSVSLSNGNYRLGFYIGKADVIGKKNNGKYLLEYYCNNKLARKTYNIHYKNTKENVLYDDSNRHTMLFIDEFNIPNDIACHDFRLKLTSQKNFSLFGELNISNPTTFYIRRSDYESHFAQVLKQEAKNFRTKYPNDFKNVPITPAQDSNSTKQKLLDALVKKDLHTFQMLLKKDYLSVDINLGEDDYGMRMRRTPLIYASYFNDLPTVKYLLKSGSDISHKDFIKKRAIQYAIENNATKTVEYLLDHGVDKKMACYVHEYKVDRSYLTPLAFAVKNEYYELFKILLEHGFRKIDFNCKGIDIGEDSALANALVKIEGNKKKKNKHFLGAFERDPKFHIYSYLYHMQYPVRFLKLYKQYGLKDEKYEKKHTKEWFRQDYEECITGMYGGRCTFIKDENISLQDYDVFKFFDIIGYQNRNTKNKRSK